MTVCHKPLGRRDLASGEPRRGSGRRWIEAWSVELAGHRGGVAEHEVEGAGEGSQPRLQWDAHKKPSHRFIIDASTDSTTALGLEVLLHPETRRRGIEQAKQLQVIVFSSPRRVA